MIESWDAFRHRAFPRPSVTSSVLSVIGGAIHTIGRSTPYSSVVVGVADTLVGGEHDD